MSNIFEIKDKYITEDKRRSWIIGFRGIKTQQRYCNWIFFQ